MRHKKLCIPHEHLGGGEGRDPQPPLGYWGEPRLAHVMEGSLFPSPLPQNHDSGSI